MIFPLALENLTLLLVITSAILLVTAEVLSLKYGKINLLIDRKKLKNAGIATGLLAIASMIIWVYNTLLL
jgi:hypothetical protein